MGKAVENHLGPLSSWRQGRGTPGPAPETLVSIFPETRMEVDSFKLASLHTESCLSVIYQVIMSWFARQHLMLELELRGSQESSPPLDKPMNTGLKEFVLVAVFQNRPKVYADAAKGLLF
ncbi:Hypothetical predicted protein [Marmota monax]|uniref:Uncharacterized protein n=1 Tax=Marmota monax TaxID=9995 RepID=A0A5E4AKZ0_MARMO|nr:hypothetical protein GHT09_000312 [Marmota monax]VTJ57620.1 Hypothetical predicted protein [Marmota monax]